MKYSYLRSDSGHPGHSNHQYGNFQGPPSQNDTTIKVWFHLLVLPNYPRNTVPSDAMYGQFTRGAGMNKPFQHDPQSQAGMFPNYQQQSSELAARWN